MAARIILPIRVTARTLPLLSEGDEIAVHQNGDVVLEGILISD